MASGSDLRNSALWAAWGDALGFITELADVQAVNRRAGVSRVSLPVPWRRRLGGRFGVDVELPEGTYSDDTQLRLATSRAIRPDGTFAVEAFSRIELPVWLAYALGGGKASKAAARNMAKSRTTWTSNFFRTSEANYLASGGNGAAMRIQPHVWSCGDLTDPTRVLAGVMRNTICTHGHPRALVGTAFHALSLAQTLETGDVPGPDGWTTIAEQLRSLRTVLKADEDIEQLWVSAWERLAARPLEPALDEAVDEVVHDIRKAEAIVRDGQGSPQDLVEDLGALAPRERGSATKCGVLASVIAWVGRPDPQATLVSVANVLGSDTDTLASMTGALLGAMCRSRPPTDVQDAAFISNEAVRLKSIADGKGPSAFVYPDALTFRLPKSVIDFVGVADGALALAGLGALQQVSEPIQSREETYQWMQLAHGQRVFVRMRGKPRPLDAGLLPRAGSSWTAPAGGRGSSGGGAARRTNDTQQLFDTEGHATAPSPRHESTTEKRSSSRPTKPLSVEELAQRVVRAGFPADLIGRYVSDLATNGDYGVQNAAAFASLVASAMRTSKGRTSRRDA
jgi:ADP-ribosylglycohydrolase